MVRILLILAIAGFAADSRNWLVDGALNSGVALAFIAAFFLRGTGYANWIPYVDPVPVIAMVVLLVPVPLKTLGANLSEVLLTAPDPETQRPIRDRVEAVLTPADREEVAIRMVPVGRFLFLQIHVLVPPGTEVRVIDERDAVPLRLYEALNDIHPRLELDVVFTADRRWVGLEGMPA